MEKSPWATYHEKTAERKPRPSVLEAIELAEHRDKALDLGAGVMSDTQLMLDRGFAEVVAVDKEPGVLEMAEKKIDASEGRLKVVISDLADFDFAENSYDLINAQYSLPFMTRENFEAVFARLKGSLKPGGVFVASLFGDDDDWNLTGRVAGITPEGLEFLLADMETIRIDEEHGDGPDAAGQIRRKHIFHVLARKTSEAIAETHEQD